MKDYPSGAILGNSVLYRHAKCPENLKVIPVSDKPVSRANANGWSPWSDPLQAVDWGEDDLSAAPSVD